MAKPSQRVAVNLRGADLERLDEVAEANRLTRNDAIRKALATEAFVQRELQTGHKILIEDEKGNIRQVEFV